VPADEGWQPTAAYLYTLTLDRESLAWEYLRRNRHYLRHWAAWGYQAPVPIAEFWGLRSLEDPARDARAASPVWFDVPNPTQPSLHLSAHPRSTRTFDLWAIPGFKDLMHDETGWRLTVRDGRQTLRLVIPAEMSHGTAFAITVPADGEALPTLRAAQQFLASLDSAQTRKPIPRARLGRPTPEQTAHARTLQALDGKAAGATHREIACALFGSRDVFERWTTNSELRAQIRHLLRRGQAFVEGGYRRFLTRR